MFRAIRQAIFRRKLEAKVEAEKRFDDLCQKAGTEVAVHYGQPEPPYSVIGQLWLLCAELDARDGEW